MYTIFRYGYTLTWDFISPKSLSHVIYYISIGNACAYGFPTSAFPGVIILIHYIFNNPVYGKIYIILLDMAQYYPNVRVLSYYHV